MTTYNLLISHPDTATQVEDFGVTDKNGRKIGARVTLGSYSIVAMTPEQKAAWDQHDAANTTHLFYQQFPARTWVTQAEVGEYVYYRPSSLRDGSHFGASQTNVSFTDVAKRDAAVAKYFKGARARAIKQWGAK